jgi:hypothetical protein
MLDGEATGKCLSGSGIGERALDRRGGGRCDEAEKEPAECQMGEKLHIADSQGRGFAEARREPWGNVCFIYGDKYYL